MQEQRNHPTRRFRYLCHDVERQEELLSDTDSENELQEHQEERPVPIPKRKKA